MIVIGHSIIVGKTMYGKTTLVKSLTRSMNQSGIPILVLTPFPDDPEWRGFAAVVTDDPDLFVDMVFKNHNCAVVVDEGAEMAGRYDKITPKLATRGRHHGHTCFFIGQLFMDVNKSIRNNCSNLFLFRSSADECHLINRVFVNDIVLEGPTLNKGECIALIDDQPPRRFNVFKIGQD